LELELAATSRGGMPESARGSSRSGLASARGSSRGGAASARGSSRGGLSSARGKTPGSARDRLPGIDQNSLLIVDGHSANDDKQSELSHHLGVEFEVDPAQHRLAQAELKKRGNVADLEDANRVYNAGEQRKWEQKYKFFSNRAVEKSYKIFARARHDPFNKDPSWGKSILTKVGHACDSRGIAPEELFLGVDITGDGNLNRPEMKKVILSVLPSMSDQELVAIFDTIDEDKSGEVNVDEFLSCLKSSVSHGVSQEATKWRNPVHRTKRFAPATIEGWDHLQDPPQYKRLEHLVTNTQQGMQDRLTHPLAMSSPAGGKEQREPSKYLFFVGGADADRFRHQKWMKDAKHHETNGTKEAFTRCRLTDPGPIPKPGWMYNSELREVSLAGKRGGYVQPGVADTAWVLPRTPRSARSDISHPVISVCR